MDIKEIHKMVDRCFRIGAAEMNFLRAVPTVTLGVKTLGKCWGDE
jgi:hypothetical protein